jgi:proline dehydrogenase
MQAGGRRTDGEETMLKALFLRLSKSRWLKRLAMGSWIARRMSRRFIAGNSLPEAVESAKRLNMEGLHLTMDHVGEAVSNEAEADVAVGEYCELLDRISQDRVLSTISVKPTQLGLALDQEKCLARFDRLFKKAVELKLSIEIDMEDSPFVDITLELYSRFLSMNPKARVCLQAYLYRSAKDLDRIVQLGGSVRLVKGAYKEAPEIAYPRKVDVDRNFVRLVEQGLAPEAAAKGFYLAVASHDEKMVNAARDIARRNGIRPDRLEFQFLYGIRGDLQRRLAREGYTVRTYLPYGKEWFPYFMRRLAERPANLIFLLKNLLRG